MGPSAEEIFSEIYNRNTWGGKESVSGKGSSLIQTGVIRAELPALLRGLGVRSMLDIPCGDFFWMKQVELGTIDYTGGDIVAALIQQDRKRHESAHVHFRKLNLIADKLPRADLVFCRDGLVHFSFEDVFSSLRNVCDSGAKYLLTTTFPARSHNDDIATGRWRTLNFELAPFSFPAPLKLLNEHCSEADGEFRDKSLGLWRVADVAKCLPKSSNGWTKRLLRWLS